MVSVAPPARAAMGAAMTLEAGHVLAMGAGALVLACLSFMADLNGIAAWGMRLIAWALLATVVLTAP
jgi:hypothetical protein